MARYVNHCERTADAAIRLHDFPLRDDVIVDITAFNIPWLLSLSLVSSLTALILFLYSRGLSKSFCFPDQIPFLLDRAWASTCLYLSSKLPNSAPLLASYTVAMPAFSISSPTFLRSSPRRTNTVATIRSYWSRLYT